jgi:hypothetical protein
MEHVRFASLDSQFDINLLRFASIFKFCNINMFALLQNQTCLLLLDKEENIIIKAFIRFRFASIPLPLLHPITVFPEETLLFLSMSTLQRPVLHPDMSTHLGLSCIWTCLIHRSQCLLTVKRVLFALKIICLLSDVFALLRKLFSFYLICSLCFEINLLTEQTCSLCFKNIFLSI